MERNRMATTRARHYEQREAATPLRPTGPDSCTTSRQPALSPGQARFEHLAGSRKLMVPKARPGTVNRGGLARSVSSQDQGVVAISAPAGYGKTTLMAQSARLDRRNVVWLSLDRGDNDLVSLTGSLATALAPVRPVDQDFLDELTSPSGLSPRRVATCLAASMSTAEGFLILLDDLHLVDAADCRSALDLLVDYLPPGSTVVAASRGEVWLDLPRRRLGGDLLELQTGQLAFDRAEAAQLLSGAGVHLRTEELTDLIDRTEGWAAGLYLASMVLRDRPSPADGLRRFGGDDSFVSDYLCAEVIDHLSGEVRRFLTRTSVLERLCGPLCDQALGTTRSSQMLASLERSNLFLIPLDHHREWYRYHGMFREMLQAQLAREEPDLVQELHRRAADWYEDNRRPESAIDHARAGGDPARAVRLMASCASHPDPPVYFDPDERWGGSPPGEIAHDAWLATLAAWTSAMNGRPFAASRWAAIAERSSCAELPPDGPTTIESARAMLRALMCSQGAVAMLADAEFANSQERPGTTWKMCALAMLFAARQLAGDATGAATVLEEWLEQAEAIGDTTLGYALAERALRAIARGAWDSAAKDLEQARTFMAQRRRKERAEENLVCLILAGLARVAVHHGEHSLARDKLTEAMGIREISTSAWPSFAVELRLELAKAALAIADLDGAVSVLEEIDHILRHCPDLGTLNREVDKLREQLATAPRNMADSDGLTAAELRLLPYLKTNLMYPEIAQRLYVSKNTVKTQAKSLYLKLGVSTRNGAVEHARRLGLLTG